MVILYLFIFNSLNTRVFAYSNWNPLKLKQEHNKVTEERNSCAAFDSSLFFGKTSRVKSTKFTINVTYVTIGTPTTESESIEEWQDYIRQVLSGEKNKELTDDTAVNSSEVQDITCAIDNSEKLRQRQESGEINADIEHYPSGKLFRSELFQNYGAAHLPFSEFMFKGHSRLKVTNDLMQTALNAFAILFEGSLQDLMQLPPEYLLMSARTIAMMKLQREKFAAIWNVIKGKRKPEQIEIDTLELFRPLFHYLSGKEISRLNLTDVRILKYIGTHPDLDRLQVGVVASKYMQINRKWMEPGYLNMMNNLLCGVPMTMMRRVPENTYLQLSQQVFYHTRACDPLQRRFYLYMMTRSQALGKPYSWSASDVAKLGFLLTEVQGKDLCNIIPEAMAGISSQVMISMQDEQLLHFSPQQVKYLEPKAYGIYASKVKRFRDYKTQFNCGVLKTSRTSVLIITLFIVVNYRRIS